MSGKFIPHPPCLNTMLTTRLFTLFIEIRQLDSERQSLVYNHHHELIAASDTIGAMKSHAESLDADLDLLRAAFSDISRLCNEVSPESQGRGTPPRRQISPSSPHDGRNSD